MRSCDCFYPDDPVFGKFNQKHRVSGVFTFCFFYLASSAGLVSVVAIGSFFSSPSLVSLIIVCARNPNQDGLRIATQH